jgi:hypothetical protein
MAHGEHGGWLRLGTNIHEVNQANLMPAKSLFRETLETL